MSYSLKERVLLKKNGIGLMGGASGIALFFFYYGQYMKSKTVYDYAECLLEEIFDSLNYSSQNISPYYAGGISGVFAVIIRSSERNLYQQVTDIYATAVDYDPRADVTRRFFATVQNKMHYAAYRYTAVEVIYEWVDAEKPMVGMTNFKGDYITKDDVKISKNYLSECELQVLNLLVYQYLDFAELQVLEQRPMTMQQWIEKLDGMLSMGGHPLLAGAGTISHEQAVEKATREFEAYRRELLQYESDFDRTIKELKVQADGEEKETI